MNKQDYDHLAWALLTAERDALEMRLGKLESLLESSIGADGPESRDLAAQLIAMRAYLDVLGRRLRREITRLNSQPSNSRMLSFRRSLTANHG